MYIDKLPFSFQFLGLGLHVAQSAIDIERGTKRLLLDFCSGENEDDFPPSLRFFGPARSIKETVDFLDDHINVITTLIQHIKKTFEVEDETDILLQELQNSIDEFVAGRNKKFLGSQRGGQRGGLSLRKDNYTVNVH